jgi:hypothetical protein
LYASVGKAFEDEVLVQGVVDGAALVEDAVEVLQGVVEGAALVEYTSTVEVLEGVTLVEYWSGTEVVAGFTFEVEEVVQGVVEGAALVDVVVQEVLVAGRDVGVVEVREVDVERTEEVVAGGFTHFLPS